MAKTSQKLAHLAKAAQGAKDLANKSERELRHEKVQQARAKGSRARIARDNGIDEQTIAEVDPGSVPWEEPDQLLALVDNQTDADTSAALKMRKAELKALYIQSTLAPKEFWDKYLREGESRITMTKIADAERWDDQRVSYHEDRIDVVVQHFKQDMEDQLEEHNQMHLDISKAIGKKIMQVLPSVVKPVEIQACAVALKNIQAVSRLALGASTDNTALKGVDDFEEFLKGVSKQKKVEAENGQND